MTTSSEVPGRLPVSVNGHNFLADPPLRRTIPVAREQADTSTEAGEQSLNRGSLWRRSQESWHHGAGQDFLDGRQGDEPTDPHRFRSSKGLDIWTKGQVSLLHPTLKVYSTTGTNLYLAVGLVPLFNVFALVVADGTGLYSSPMPFNLLNSIALQTGTGWTATNATIAASTDDLRLTATAAAIVETISPAGTAGIPVEAGREYAFGVRSLHISGGAARTPTVAVRWYTAAGATISTSTPEVAAASDGAGGVTVYTTEVAPATAAFAALIIAYTAASAIGEIHEIDAGIGPYDVVDTIGIPDTWGSIDIQAGQAAQTVMSIATDGTYVWAALNTSGIHRATIGSTTATADAPAAPGSGRISLVGYANGYVLAAGSSTSTIKSNVLWRVDNPVTGTPTLVDIKTHPNDQFVWTGISSGRSVVYAYGNSGGNGEVWKIPFDPNTGTLAAAASSATMLPEGETIHALYFYAGAVIMGTGRGVRIGQADGAGNIDYGPLIETDWPVRCLEPQGRYCWFGWSRYDATNSGLGRIDLGFLIDTLTPAWASDLMTSDASTGDVISAVTMAPYGYTDFQRPPVRVFSVAGEGVYIEDPMSRVSSGTLETGTIRFSTSEPKLTRSLDVRHHALPAGGAVHAELKMDEGAAYLGIGSSSVTDSFGPAAPLDAGSYEVESMEFRYTLERPDNAGTDFSRSPELTRWTAKVLPQPSTVDETFQIPLIMRRSEQTNTGDGVPYHIDVEAEVAYLKGLERSREIIDIQIGGETISDCYVSGSEFRGDQWGPGNEWVEGIFVIEISTARG